VAFATERFLRDEAWQDGISEVLEHLGSALDASRAYLFQNARGPDGRLWMDMRSEWDAEGTRQIFEIAVESVQTSCGWGVPLMATEKPRETLVRYHAQQDPAKWVEKVSGRTRSIDGLPTRPTDRYLAGKA